MSTKVFALLTVLAGLAWWSTSASAAVKPAASGTVYGGHSSQDDPFVIKLAADRKHVAAADLYVEGTCADGKHITFAQPARFLAAPQPGMVVAPGDNVFFGRGLSKTGAFVADGLSVGNYGAVTAAITEHLTAKFRKGKATGTYKATMEIRDNQTQQPVTTCETPAITWTTASAMGHVFGGLTSQGLPAVVEMNGSATRVNRIRVAWSSHCAMSGVSFTFGDVLGNFAVSAHAFGTSFGDESTGADGSRATFAYDLSGNVGKTTSTGQLQVKETDLDPQGATTDTCDTGAISWRLASSRR